MSVSINLGNCFKIPLKNGTFGVGYLIAKSGSALYLGALKFQFESESEFDNGQLENVDNFCLFGNFLNSKLKNGDWQIFKTVKPNKKIYPFPYSKIKIGDNYVIENWDKKYVRNATAEDILFYDNPTIRAPMILQNALKALHGLHEWDFKYEKIKAEYVTQRSM